MRVGVYLKNSSPEDGGGYTFQEEVVRSLIELGEESHHSFVVFRWGSLPIAEESSRRINFVSLHRALIMRKGDHLSRISRMVANYLLNGNYHLSPNWVGRAIMKTAVDVIVYLGADCPTMDVPFITTVWDIQHRLQPFFPEVSIGGEWDAREDVFRRTLRRAAIVITGTEAGKTEVERFYQVPSDRIRILPHPTPRFALNPPPTTTDVLRKYDVQEGYLFYPAQFWPHKNHVGLLKAVHILREEHNLRLHTLFVGSDKGNEQFIRETVRRLDLSDQVRSLGFVPQADMVSLYRNAFALVYVSFFGPENLPPLEAFALGCPVIAANVPGAEEQLGDAALLVDPRDERQIATKIMSLHNDPGLREALVQRGLQRAASNTGIDFARGLLSIIDELEPVRRCWPV